MFAVRLHQRVISDDVKKRLRAQFFQMYATTSTTTVRPYNAASVTFPSQAQVVIAGAGIIGNSVAYHLLQQNWSDVVVLERNSIGSGSSYYSSGVLGLLKEMAAHRDLIWSSMKLYERLQTMGYSVGLEMCGSLNLAQTSDRWIALKRAIASNTATGLQCQLLDPVALQQLYPFMKVDDLAGAVWIPEDCVANSRDVCNVLSLLVQQGGGKYFEYTHVEKAIIQNERVCGVETSKGMIKCEYFVNCAGLWARELGLRTSTPVRIPVYPNYHTYAITSVSPTKYKEGTPIIRDFDALTYCRSYKGGYLIGWFDPNTRNSIEDDVSTSSDSIEIDWSHFTQLWKRAIHRLPDLSQCNTPTVINCVDSYTPDGRWILGETAEVSNYFVASGTNGNSLQAAGGIGKALAEWIIAGKPSNDLLPFNIQRFSNVHNTRRYLQQRTKEIVGRRYAILHPHQSEYKFARNLRTSPLHSVLCRKGAVFGIRMAHERPLYFDTSLGDSSNICRLPISSFFKPKFFDFMLDEYSACHEAVGIIDMSSFSKIEVYSNGLECVKYLQNLCSNVIDIPVGHIVRTGMQNERGGYENDCMIVRQSDYRYFIVSPTSQETYVYEWLSKHLPHNSGVHLNDVTSMYTVLNIVGPKANSLLNELSEDSIKLMPFTAMQSNFGYASDVMIMAFTHTGEQGYCLYIPSEYALHVYYQIMTVGKDYGVRDVGTLTQRFMRIERFIPFWAEELNSITTPFESGKANTVRLDKENFIGKSALLKQKKNGVAQQLLFFYVENIDPENDIWPWGGEPIYRNNEFVGMVTSAGYGFSSKKLICLGFIRRPLSSKLKIVNHDYILSKDAFYEIDIAGRRFPLVPHLHPPPISVAFAPEKKTYRPTVICGLTEDC